MQLTNNFTDLEFACRDGSSLPVELWTNLLLLAANLQVLRDDIGEPIHVNSGYRTPAYNKKVGGKPKSYHLRAMAADITAKNYSPKQLAARIEALIKGGKMKEGGLGIYKGFVHYDIRGVKARW